MHVAGLLRAVGAAFLGLFFQVASAAGGPATVYPTGVFPDDVNHVQAAVNRGGVVLLKAVNASGVPTAFNFGTAGPNIGQSSSVTVSKDVSILGEHVSSHQTTIDGGFNTITINSRVKTKISGIDFEGPFWTAINVANSTGMEITGNTIHNVIPVPVEIVATGEIITFADAIAFYGYNLSTYQSDPTQISGNVLIAGNVIDGSGGNISFGIQFDTVGANIEIFGNIVRNLEDATTEGEGAVVLARSEGHVTISANLIAPGPGQSGMPGIFIAGNAGARYEVFANEIITVDPFADGIDVAGGEATDTTGTVGASIYANDITINGGYGGGVMLFDLVTGTDVTANLIKGTGLYALGITTYGFETDIASSNRLTNNQIRNLTPSVADVFFDSNTQNNVEVGFCRTVLDEGSGNSSTCHSSIATAAAIQATPDVARAAAVGAAAQSFVQKRAAQRLMLTAARRNLVRQLP